MDVHVPKLLLSPYCHPAAKSTFCYRAKSGEKGLGHRDALSSRSGCEVAWGLGAPIEWGAVGLLWLGLRWSAPP